MIFTRVICEGPTDDVTLAGNLASETLDGSSHLVDLTGRQRARFLDPTAVQ